jgi:hypothetical protein
VYGVFYTRTVIDTVVFVSERMTIYLIPMLVCVSVRLLDGAIIAVVARSALFPQSMRIARGQLHTGKEP